MMSRRNRFVLLLLMTLLDTMIHAGLLRLVLTSLIMTTIKVYHRHLVNGCLTRCKVIWRVRAMTYQNLQLLKLSK